MKIRVDWPGAGAKVGRRAVAGLTPLELRLLGRFAQAKRGAVVSRGALLVAGWPGKTLELWGATRKVDVAVSRLRAKLERVGVDVEAVAGEGYRI